MRLFMPGSLALNNDELAIISESTITSCVMAYGDDEAVVQSFGFMMD